MAESFHEFLSRMSMFKDYSESEIDELLRITNRARFKPGTAICAQGERGDSMYIIRSGIVSVQTAAPTGATVTLARLSEGMVVGEMSLIDNSPRSASLVAESEVVLYVISRANFDRLKAEMNPAAYKLMRAIGQVCCERLRDVNEQISHYMEDPMRLFEPEVKTGSTDKTRILADRFKGFFGRK